MASCALFSHLGGRAVVFRNNTNSELRGKRNVDMVWLWPPNVPGQDAAPATCRAAGCGGCIAQHCIVTGIIIITTDPSVYEDPVLKNGLVCGSMASRFWACNLGVRGRVQPLLPAELREAAAAQNLRVVVFRAGQLPLRPGLSEEQLGSLFAMYGRGN